MATPLDTPQNPTVAVEKPGQVENPSSPHDFLKEETQKAEDPSHTAALDRPGEDPLNSPAKNDQVANTMPDNGSVSSSTTDVPFMDWTDFESNYTKALIDANDVEDQLVGEFVKLSNVSRAEIFLKHLLMCCQVFMLWADASAQHDNKRVFKR
jgi:hypothetical protein